MLSREEYRQLDLVALSELVSKRELSPTDVVETAIREIEELNPEVNAVVVRQFERALDEIQTRSDRPRFLGMPYLAKDLHAPVKGLALANGSRLLKDQVFDFDSTTFSRLRAAGFAILGRSNSPEFGLSASTEPAYWGPTRNPHNTDLSAGGSSGGAAAAVASGMMPAAHATDSAGSIRIPAARCGVIGFKPTRGLIAIGPHRGDPVLGISHEHAVTRTVRDCAAILDVTAGPDVGAPYFTPVPDRSFETLIKQEPPRLKVALVTSTFAGEAIDTECKEAVLHAGRSLDELGHRVEEDAPAFDVKLTTESMIRVLMASLAAPFRSIEQQLGRPISCPEVEPLTRSVIDFAMNTTLADHLERAAVVNTQARLLGAFFERYDVLVTPTLAAPTLKLGVLDTSTDDLDEFMDRLFSIAPFTASFNVTGQPAISLPLHRTSDELPIGVQLVGRFAEDALLMQLAASLEQFFPHRTDA